jgi:hypothetical protein
MATTMKSGGAPSELERLISDLAANYFDLMNRV